MIAKFHRFHGYGSLRAVYSRGQTIRGPLFNLKYVQRGGDRPYRLAVVVSRKVSKSAVVRNRIRRRLYEAVRTMPNQPAPGSDIVLTVFADSVATMDAAELQASVARMFEKANTGQP